MIGFVPMQNDSLKQIHQIHMAKYVTSDNTIHLNSCLMYCIIGFKSKKMKYILLLLLLSPVRVFSQKDCLYYKYVTQAELSLCDSNWITALSFYHKAIDKRKYNSYSFDVHNALVCCVLLKKNKEALVFAEILVVKGCDKEYFAKECFYKFNETQEYSTLLQKMPSLMKLRSKSKNFDIAATIDSLYSIDQDNNIANRNAVFLSNAIKLREIIKENGYPSENITGIYLEHQRFFVDRVSTMLFHLLSYNRDDIGLIPLLYDKTLKGQFHPAFFTWLPFKEKKYRYGLNGNNILTIVDNEIYICNPNISQLLEYNKRREEICLPDFNTFKKITTFYYKDKRFLHPIDGRINIIDFANEESKLTYLKGYKKI